MPTQKKRRSRGTGAIMKNSSGYYAYQYKDAAGARRTQSLKTKSLKEAKKQAEELEKAAVAKDAVEALQVIARHKDLLHVDPMPITDVWEEFLKTGPTAGPGTLGLYRAIWNRFSAWLAEHRPNITDLADVDTHTAQAYLDERWAEGIAASTYNDVRNALGHISKALAARKRGLTNPWPAGRAAQKKQEQQKRLPLDQTHRKNLLGILDELQHEHAAEIRVLFMLGLYAGMRLGDAATLKSDCIKNGWITYTPEKTKRTSRATARIPVLPPLAEALGHITMNADALPAIADLYRRHQSSAKRMVMAIITDATGGGTQEHDGQHIQARTPYGFHSLRHTFATEAAKAGATTGHLKSMLGDNIATIDRYYTKTAGLQSRAEIEFQPLPSLLAGSPRQSERDQLHSLVDTLPIEVVRKMLNEYTTTNTKEITA